MASVEPIVRVHRSITEIPVAQWRALESSDFPFSDYEFLEGLEASRSVGAGTGWQPCFIGVWQDTELLAACYCYQKSHSYGEYIFDWGWAEAAQSAGLPYYPKVVSAVPFTPATGPKLLMRNEGDSQRLTHLILQEMSKLGYSAHLLFITPEEAPLVESEGYVVRHSHQFHWGNRGYKSFEDFLNELKQKRSKEIRRERRSIVEQEIRIERLTGEKLTPDLAREAYRLYIGTIEKKCSQDYLTEDFFLRVFATMQDRIFIFCAYSSANEPLAMSLSFQKGQKLFGRYWGAHQEIRNLHFELCYYQLIELAIEKNLQTVEAGAQGPQKINRGFEPKITLSAHKFKHQSLSQAVTQFVEQERSALSEALEGAKGALPFKQH